mgnify:CR=1 FL=1
MPSNGNHAEREVRAQLEAEGWSVYSKGWPDYLAVKDGTVRFIEVKPSGGSGLSSAQQVVFDVLHSLGLQVEVIRASVKGRDTKLNTLPPVYFTKLGSGEWGVRGPRDVIIPGQRVYVARKGEEPKPVRIGEIRWTGQAKRVVIATFKDED